ncbi:MAG: hypothetical protein AAFU67_18615, partial [Bacteroidota bacterium]
MNNNRLERLLRESYRTPRSFRPSQDGWERLAQDLPQPTPQAKGRLWWLLLPSLLIGLFIGINYYFTEQTIPLKSFPIAATVESAEPQLLAVNTLPAAASVLQETEEVNQTIVGKVNKT